MSSHGIEEWGKALHNFSCHFFRRGKYFSYREPRLPVMLVPFFPHLIHFFVTSCNFSLSACAPKLLLAPDFFVQHEPSDALGFHTEKSLNAKWLQIVQICP